MPVRRDAEGDRPVRRVLPDRRITIIHQLITVVFKFLTEVVEHRPSFMAGRTAQAVLPGESRNACADWLRLEVERLGLELQLGKTRQQRTCDNGAAWRAYACLHQKLILYYPQISKSGWHSWKCQKPTLAPSSRTRKNPQEVLPPYRDKIYITHLILCKCFFTFFLQCLREISWV